MTSKITPRHKNRARVATSSDDAQPTKRKRGAYKYTYISSKTRRGNVSWKEANTVYEDYDSEVEPTSLMKQKHHQNIEDHSLVNYDREIYDDFGTRGLNGIQQKTKVSTLEIMILEN